MPPFPPAGPRRAAFPVLFSTVKALRLPASNTGSLMDSFARPEGDPSFAPQRCRIPPHGPAPIKPGATGYFSSVDTQDLPGSWTVHSMPLPRSPIPAGQTLLTVALRLFRPRRIENE